MNKKWEIQAVSTSGRIFNRIRKEMAQPVGIVLFGADCDLKNEVKDEFLAGFGEGLVWDYYRSTTADRVEGVFRIGESFMVVLDSNESAVHDIRHRLVQNLRSLGAETVVGIYAKMHPIWLGDRRSTDEDPTNCQAWRLLNDPPTADGLDYFVVVEEERGKKRGKKRGKTL